jgi:hypothetical protein
VRIGPRYSWDMTSLPPDHSQLHTPESPPPGMTVIHGKHGPRLAAGMRQAIEQDIVHNLEFTWNDQQVQYLALVYFRILALYESTMFLVALERGSEAILLCRPLYEDALKLRYLVEMPPEKRASTLVRIGEDEFREETLLIKEDPRLPDEARQERLAFWNHGHEMMKAYAREHKIAQSRKPRDPTDLVKEYSATRPIERWMWKRSQRFVHGNMEALASRVTSMQEGDRLIMTNHSAPSSEPMWLSYVALFAACALEHAYVAMTMACEWEWTPSPVDYVRAVADEIRDELRGQRS